MFYPNLMSEDPILLEITTRDYETEESKYKTERHDYEKNLKSIKIDNDYKSNFKSLKK